MMQAFVPKNRRPRFDFTLRIHDLNNIPLVVGTAYVKWHLPSSTSAEHHGHTDKTLIQDHRASWDYTRTLPVRMTIDRNQMLHECEIHFETIQEFSSGGRGDRMTLGTIKLNLAEYVDQHDDEEGITRRYLVQESKINCTLKVGIVMRQVDGDTNFITPPLKTAMVFGGIAGVISGEQGDADDSGRIPSINHRNREMGDLQDMYRRTLAASWACRAGELPPDHLIEDIFAGGDGWESGAPMLRVNDDYEDSGSLSDTDSRRTIRYSPRSQKRSKTPFDSYSPHGGKANDFASIESGKEGLDQPFKYETPRSRSRKGREISEFDVREDLRSWEITPHQ